MTFVQLFQLYVTFMGSNDLRHSDLVKPIREFAQATRTNTDLILQRLQVTYRSL